MILCLMNMHVWWKGGRRLNQKLQAVLKKKTVEKKQVFDDNNKRSNKHEMQQDALQRKFQQITLNGTSIVRMNGPVCQ